MKQRWLLLCLVLAVAALPARAGSILCPGCIPSLDVYVNDSFLANLAGVSSNGGATFTISALLGNPGQFAISVLAVTNPDPFVDYGLSVSNFSDSSTSFSLTFTTPTVGGPFTNTSTQVDATVTDLGSDGASVVGDPYGGDVLAQNGDEPGLAYTVIGGELIGQVGSGCNALPGSSQNCGFQQAGFSHPDLNGNLTVQLNFTLGPTDQITFFNSRSTVNPVPEPGAWLMAAGGLGWLLWHRRASRHAA